MRWPLAMMLVLGASGHSPARAAPLLDPTHHELPFTGPDGDGATMAATNPAALTAIGAGWHLYIESRARLTSQRTTRTLTDPRTGASQVRTTAWDESGLGGAITLVTAGRPFSFAFRGPNLTPAEHTGDDEQSPFGRGRYRSVAWGGLAFGLALASVARVGVAVELTQSYYDYRFTRDEALRAAADPVNGLDGSCGGSRCGLENPWALSRVALKTKSSATDSLTASLGWVFGAQLRVGNNRWFGLSYRLPPGGFRSPVTLANDPNRPSVLEAAPRDGSGVTATNSRLRLYLPHWLMLSYSAALAPRTQLLAGVRYTMHRPTDGVDIRLFGTGVDEAAGWILRPQNRRDQALVYIGIEQLDLGRSWSLGGRVAIETPAVAPSEVNPHSVERWRGTAALAARWRVSERLAGIASYGFSAKWPMSGVGAAYSARYAANCADSGYDYTEAACAAVRNGHGDGDANGEYRQFEHLARIAFEFTLR